MPKLGDAVDEMAELRKELIKVRAEVLRIVGRMEEIYKEQNTPKEPVPMKTNNQYIVRLQELRVSIEKAEKEKDYKKFAKLKSEVQDIFEHQGLFDES